MSIIEALANRIADGLASQLNLDQERKAVIAYGFIGILQGVALFLMISVIGILTGTVYEVLIIFLSVGYIRKSTGGAHSRTMWGCNTVSVFSISLLALASKYLLGMPVELSVNIGFTIILFLAEFMVFHKRVPVDSPNKPIVSAEKISRLRRESFTKLFLFLLLTGAAIAAADTHIRLYSIASSIRMAMIWQVITLTEKGASLLAKVDSAVNGLFSR